jgi:NitT/TauT family transport system ATP-binding protein
VPSLSAQLSTSVPISAATTPKIVIRNLHKVFRTRRGQTEALAGIDVAIGESEFLCIVGPSGCGKTTLLRIIAGLETQTSGELEIAQQDPARPLNSMVFQEQSLFPWMNVLDNAASASKCAACPSRSGMKRHWRSWTSSG